MRLTRRDFLGKASAAAAGLSLGPSRRWTGSPNEKLNVAFIGVGGRGRTNLAGLSAGNIAMQFPGRKLAWDGAAGRFTDCEDANSHLDTPYRRGWSL